MRELGGDGDGNDLCREQAGQHRVSPDAAVDEGFSDSPYDGSLAQEIAWQPREGVEVCRRWVILPAAQSSKDDRKSWGTTGGLAQ